MRALHDEFDSLFVKPSNDDEGDNLGPNAGYWLSENRGIVFAALRDFVTKWKAKEATTAALVEAEAAIAAARKAFIGKFE